MRLLLTYARTIYVSLIAFALAISTTQAQDLGMDIPPEITDSVQIERHSRLYNQAYLEMAGMLDGKQELSIKRAVFLLEWAYLDGKLDYDEFCRNVDEVATYLKAFIAINNLDQYKTGKNFALFDYFSQPSSGNGGKPFSYDYEDFGGTDDYTKLFVSKVMRTHTGQCRSLPMYYKILAEAIGAEAYIALAPQHYFIRHRDETDPAKWVNVELTGPSLSREIFIIEQFGITDTAIRNKVYMYPLSDKETIALLMSELWHGYARKFDTEYDDLMWLCATKSLEYYPQNITALSLKANIINMMLMEHLASNGNVMDDRARMIDEQWYLINDTIESLGWSEMDDATYERLIQGVEREMEKHGADPADGRKQVEEMRKQQ
jgi:hypothetical protein